MVSALREDVLRPRGRSLRTALALWTLLVLFVARVTGQLLVALGAAPWLPPMEAWYSGLLPYRPLLASQIVIIVVLTKVCLDLTRGAGYFADTRPRLGSWLWVFGWIYLSAMILRYVLRMASYPEERWTGGTIPIVFHWVLASYLLTLAAYHRRTARD
jgi:hypothetical protein